MSKALLFANKQTMKKLLGIIVLGLLLSGSAYSHEDLTQNPPHKAHEPYKCKLDQDRTAMERFMCKASAKNHRLCKLDSICALRKIEELENEIKKLKE